MHVLTVVCGTGLLLLGAAGAAGIDNPSGISPLLSKTLEIETMRSVTFFAPNKRQEWDKYSEKSLPRVCWPTEHLTAVFDDVLVAVWVLDSVLS